MKISTWNINSIRARLPILLDWLKSEAPDVVLLQELKCQKENFPLEEIEELGYNIALSCQKSYNGVAIFSKFPISDINLNFLNNPLPLEARFIEAIITIKEKAVRVASVYIPNGQELNSLKFESKISFVSSLAEHYYNLVKEEENLIIGGDFNIALNPQDVYDSNMLEDSLLFSLTERKELRKFVSSHFFDCYRELNPYDEGFTWWDYRANSFKRNLGLRIDYLFCTVHLLEKLKECYSFKNLRDMEKASDHIPVTAIFKMIG